MGAGTFSLNCSRCGEPFEPDCDFCTNCGAAKDHAAHPRPPAPYQWAEGPRAPDPPHRFDAPPQQLQVQYIPPAQWHPAANAQYAQHPAAGYQYRPAGRKQVNVGLCVLLSFLWTGAGFFFIPDRVGTGLLLVLCTLAIVAFGTIFSSVTFGFGAICMLPVGLAWWFSILMWTYKSADRYNRGA